MGYLTRKTRKSQKSYANGSPPLGEDGRGLFPLGEDLGEVLEELGVGYVTQKQPLPSPLLEGRWGAAGVAICVFRGFRC